MSSHHHPSTNPDQWSVHELKEELQSHNIDYTGCYEKDELLDLLHKIPEFAQYKLPPHPHVEMDLHHTQP